MAITHNQGLTSLNALESLNFVGFLRIGTNRQLATLDGLSGIQLEPDTPSRLAIARNPSLESIASLAGLQGELSQLRIYDNPNLNSLAGLQGLTRIGELRLEDNGPSADLEPLSELNAVDWLTLGGMPALTNLDQMAGIGGPLFELRLRDNPNLLNINQLAALENGRINRLTLIRNDRLIHIDGLKGKLASDMAFSIQIQQNAALRQVDGLKGAGMEYVKDGVTVTDNPSLRNLDGLSDLSRIEGFIQPGVILSGDLTISGNAALNDCAALGKVLGFPARPHNEDTDNVPRFLTIASNGEGAQNPDDCLDAYAERVDENK
ncbi:MAG: hypothetical protein AAGH19_01255, partial [Pseudomonadota bacterium]